ncbi:hypothetical protein D3C86_1173220 [compost metagenome]
MTATTQATVLRKFNKAELASRKDAAKDKFYNTQDGYDQFASFDPKTGRAIAGMVKGAYTRFIVDYMTEILKTYLAKIELGYTLHELEVQPLTGHSAEIYFYRPQAEIDAALEGIYEQVAQAYAAEIESENEAIVADTVAKRKVQVLKEREEAAKAADEALEAELDAEVRAELKGGK